MSAATAESTVAEGTILRRPYTLTTVGAWSLVFLAAFESLAVTTIMPIVTADLHGRALYSLAFSATLATGVVGTVVGGAWADRYGPARPLFLAIGGFVAGLAVAGTASSMAVFVAGRALQGFGAGGITVALYVVVAKVYPAALHNRIFGAFAAAWVVPSLVGPFVAGLVADALSWHWVFLGVVVLVAVATAMIGPAVRGMRPPEGGHARMEPKKIIAAGVTAVAVLALSETRFTWIVAPVALVAIVVAVRPLAPRGTLTAKPGLPATVLLCAAAGAVFFGTEVYLPLLLHDRYGLPAWLSGVTLTAAAIAWALASHLQGRFSARFSDRRAVAVGSMLLAAGAFAEVVTALLRLPAPVVAVGWFVAGAGMGTLYPRIATLVLAHSAPGEEGFNSSAKSIADSVGGSVALALTGLIFAGGSYLAVFGFTALIGVVGVVLGRRILAAPAAIDR
jgi:MFS family permease